MRIVIDLQGAQSASRDRGIGRYSLSLAQAIVRNCGGHEVIIALNGLFPDTVESIRGAFYGLIPQSQIRVWNAAGPVHSFDSQNDWRRKSAELIREDFLANLQPDIMLITSIMDGFGDNAVHSVGGHFTKIPTAAVFYDVIPLIESDIYLKSNPVYEKFYKEKLSYLSKADLLLAISESSRSESIKYLGVEPQKVINVGAATESIFHVVDISSEDVQNLRDKFALTKPFIMYSGAADERKNHLRLIKAFSLLPKEMRDGYQLAIVGKLPDPHREKFEQYAKLCGLCAGELIITGRVSDEELVYFYNLCELFVFPSWHEGFGLPLLEAMSCGAPVIGANTTSIPEVVGRTDILFDPFDSTSISKKMEEVLRDEVLRRELSGYGIERAKNFSWDHSARIAINSFEHWYEKEGSSKKEIFESDSAWLINKIAKLDSSLIGQHDLYSTAQAMARNVAASAQKQLLVDVSELAVRDSKSGIQRVVRSVLAQLLSNPPAGFIVKPVYATVGTNFYRYASQFSARFNGVFDDDLHVTVDDIVSFHSGDIFLGLDLQHHVVVSQAAIYSQMRMLGVEVYFILYDLLPILMPAHFPHGVDECHQTWLEVLAQSDGVISISRSVADEFKCWLDVAGPKRARPLNLGWFHLGADVASSVPTKGMPSNSDFVLSSLASRPTFLVVGTIEPRKGQMQTLLAFELLWAQGVDANLVFVGQHGWNIELLVNMLDTHAELGKKLFWLKGVSDEYLDNVYAASSCLIAPSEGEGFGLPLIEAAQNKLPILARDIPVFREVGGEFVTYFDGIQPSELAGAIQAWLLLAQDNKVPQIELMPWLTWQQSTESLLGVMIKNNWYQEWMPDGVYRFWGTDKRLGTQVGQRRGLTINTTNASGYLIFGPYISLPHGEYVVALHGKIIHCGVPEPHIDVALKQGSKVLYTSTLSSVAQNDYVALLKITIDTPCVDIEVRVWVGETSDIKVSLLEIFPIALAKEEDLFLLRHPKNILNQDIEIIGEGSSNNGSELGVEVSPFEIEIGELNLASDNQVTAELTSFKVGSVVNKPGSAKAKKKTRRKKR